MVSSSFLLLVRCRKMNVIPKARDGMNLGLYSDSLNNDSKDFNDLRKLDSIMEK